MFQTGCKVGVFSDPIQRAIIPITVLYPTMDAPSRQRFGPYTLDAAMDAPMAGAGQRLVVLSHGGNGSPWTLRGLGALLAQSGFVVAMPEHIGNCRQDSSLDGTLANLQNRPRHVRQSFAYVRSHPTFQGRVNCDAVGVVGMSIGGYTALAAAGGHPWANEQGQGGSAPVPIRVDASDAVGALVLLAPATFWYTPEGSLKNVHCPILMYTGTLDTVTPPWCAEVVKRGVAHPENVTHRVVEGAGHFSFLSVFPPEMCRADFLPSVDPEGFDREAFQNTMQADIVAYLTTKLGD